ncbi:permease [Alteromonas sp. ASW11-36]|uniref:Permease n=1 Tax=Alteromonas arenosi TaxID=3055817 RepID=A0ABT7SY11_9ALTE|nr:FtsX-like permease family protein [Alteromonas sp. ASW11-36]MDM7860414.1 permease [Alteromonas sp. ASW11-36]
MHKPILPLAWRLFLEDGRTVNQRVLQATQTILMVFIVTLTLTSQSVQQQLEHNMANLLGADAVVTHTGALSADEFAYLQQTSSAVIYTQSLKTTLTHADKWQRVSLKAVDENYPLQGQVQVSNSQSEASYSAEFAPAPGEIWLDPRLSSGLAIAVGDILTITDTPLTVTHILHHEPDRLMEGHNVDMRALVNRQDFTQLGFADDTIDYRYLLNADKAQIDQLFTWQQQQLPSAEFRHRQGSHPLALFWQRTENFIGLASVILLFMAAIAIYQVSRIQIRKEQHFSAVCMSVGASRFEGLKVSIYKWLMHIASLLPIVLVIATLCHFAIVDWLSATLSNLTWQPNFATAGLAFGACALLLAVFQLPVWLSLKQASVRQLVFNLPHPQRAIVSLGSAIVVLMVVTAIYSDNGLLTTMVLGSMAACVALIALVSWLSLTLGEKLTQRYSGLFSFATFMMRQRIVSKSTQIMGVGLCAFLLLFTLMLLRDLGNTMHKYQRQYDGNLFVSQADSTQMQAVESWVLKQDGEMRQQKPFMYAKLIRVNQQSLDEFATRPSESLATFKRSIRLHWTDVVPSNNRVINGQWWGIAPQETQRSQNWQQISVEQEVMTDIGLTIGDQLTFMVGEQAVNFTIVASHAYKSGAGSITFWVQMPTAAIEYLRAPHYYMASIETNEDSFSTLGHLWQQHPTLRMVSMREMMARFDNTLTLVTQIISGFAMMIICLASIVIVSSVLAYERQERKKNSVIMSFGLPKRTCLHINLIEWALTGGIAASGAMFGTWLAGVLIYQSQFSLPYAPDFIWLAGTLLVIMVIVIAIGHLASRNSLSSSVRELLAE